MKAARVRRKVLTTVQQKYKEIGWKVIVMNCSQKLLFSFIFVCVDIITKVHVIDLYFKAF